MPSLSLHARCTNVRVPITSAPSFRPRWSPRGHPQKRSQTHNHCARLFLPDSGSPFAGTMPSAPPAPSLRQSRISADPLPSSELLPVAAPQNTPRLIERAHPGATQTLQRALRTPAREPDPSSFHWGTCRFRAGLAPGGQDTTPSVGGGFGGKAEAGILYPIPSVDG